jgi:hypothetical protein
MGQKALFLVAPLRRPQCPDMPIPGSAIHVLYVEPGYGTSNIRGSLGVLPLA